MTDVFEGKSLALCIFQARCSKVSSLSALCNHPRHVCAYLCVQHRYECQTLPPSPLANKSFSSYFFLEVKFFKERNMRTKESLSGNHCLIGAKLVNTKLVCDVVYFRSVAH